LFQHLHWPAESQIEECSDGAQNRVYKVSHHDQTAIVKLYAQPNHAANEVNAFQLASGALQTKIPRVLWADLQAQPAIVIMTELTGRKLTIEVCNALEFERYAFHLGCTLGRLNSVQAQGFGRTGAIRSWFESLMLRAQSALETCFNGQIINQRFVDDFARFADQFQNDFLRVLPSLIHGDVVPKNCLMPLNLEANPGVELFDFEHGCFAALEWDMIHLERTLFVAHAELRQPLIDSWIEHSKDRGYVRSRLTAFDHAKSFYAVIEALEFWTWGMDHGFQNEIAQGVAQMRSQIRSSKP
jgi:Ser/Thr protein kinase RdoA (MazF antagonist)